MPPPSRLARSSSLRQPPVSAGLGARTGPLGHSRHHTSSQLVRGRTTSQLTKQTDPTPPSTAQRTKPQFTTFQQSFSPKKQTRQAPVPAPTASIGKVPDPSLIPSTWPEIAALQTELLQLGLFHSSYLQRNVEWQATAETSLRKKYDSVARTYHSTLAAEKERQRLLNLHALNLWFENTRENHGGPDFSEQIQTFSSIIQDVSDLSDNSGKYAQAVRVFEDWFEEADRVRRCRNQPVQKPGINESGVFVNPIDVSWKRQLYALITKLELCARQLQGLDILGYGDPEVGEDRQLSEGSAVVRVVLGLGEMITLMVDELNAMRTIENDTIRAEREWVRQQTEQLSTAPSEADDRVGIWKAVLK